MSEREKLVEVVRQERRKAVRIPAKLAMEITLSGRDLAKAESINVSANGIYFTSPIFIEPLTKLQISLLLPKPGALSSQYREVRCEGVVVRIEPEEEEPGRDHYQVACYFTSIMDDDREHLEAYILQQLAF